MELDERSTNIIQEILKNPSISKKKLEEKYQYSRRQISYSMMKINQWLTEHNFPEIWRSKNGAFIVHPSVLDALSSNIKTEKIWYVPTEKERIYFLLLMLISNEGELSLFHFMSTLQVSKNTILRDLRHAKKDLTAYDLQINYTRSKGYHLTGDEWNIRKLLVDVIEKVSNIYNGEYFIQHLTLAEDIQKHHKQLEDVEEQLQLRFTDEKMKILPYLISIMMKRIERGCYVKRSFSIDYDELSDTKEYRAAERILRDERTVPKEEKLYMTLQLLTSNVLGSSLLTDSELPKLKMVIKQCLDIFEERACIVIKEKDELLNKLFLHIKPAYYRIKYHLTTEYASIEKMMKEFETVHYIVTDAFKPLEKFIGCDIPTSELAMISVFISGHLITNQEIKEDKKRAVVVCPQGLSISQLMESVLRKLFPEFFFYPAMSLREYHKEVKPYDIVFSSIPIQTDKKLFIVDHFITDLEKIQLRERVLKDIFGFGSSALNMNHLLSIIERHTQITDKESLQKELAEYFSYQHETKIDRKRSLHLHDLIKQEHVVIRESVRDWREAIYEASKPLLADLSITNSYITAMQAEYPVLSPNIILRSNVAIPHVAPEHGVNQVSMSLLKLKKGLEVDQKIRIHFVVVIAAIDKLQHLDALRELMELASNESILSKMLETDDTRKLFQLIQV